MCKRQKQTIVELLAALKADLENERVAEHALAVLDVDEADGDHTHSCDRALESTMTTFCGKASRKQGKKRHSTKKCKDKTENPSEQQHTQQTEKPSVSCHCSTKKLSQSKLACETIFGFSRFTKRIEHRNNRTKDSPYHCRQCPRVWCRITLGTSLLVALFLSSKSTLVMFFVRIKNLEN